MGYIIDRIKRRKLIAEWKSRQQPELSVDPKRGPSQWSPEEQKQLIADARARWLEMKQVKEEAPVSTPLKTIDEIIGLPQGMWDGLKIGTCYPSLQEAKIEPSSIDRTREAIRQEMREDMTRAIEHERKYGERWHGMLHQIAAALELPEGYKLTDIIPAIKFLQTENKGLRQEVDAARGDTHLVTMELESAKQRATDADASLQEAYSEIAALQGRVDAAARSAFTVDDSERAWKALSDVMHLLAAYLPPDSGISAHDAITHILGIMDPWPLKDTDMLPYTAPVVAKNEIQDYTAADLDAKWSLGRIEGARQEREAIFRYLLNYKNSAIERSPSTDAAR